MKKKLILLVGIVVFMVSCSYDASRAYRYGSYTFKQIGTNSVSFCGFGDLKLKDSLSGTFHIPKTIYGSKVTQIDYGAFSGCKLVTKVIIPDSVTTIGHSAFEGCSALTSITIPDSVKNISRNIFAGCSSLENIVIPKSITTIDGGAFIDCSKLTTVRFDDQTGWYVTPTENASAGTNLTLDNPTQNAVYLKNKYRYYYWYKK